MEEVLVPGTPLGAFKWASYHEASAEIAAGDTVLFMSDGFAELLDPDGEPLGYDRARELFAEVANQDPHEIIAALETSGEQWRGSRPQFDDITFVVLKKKRVH